MDARMKGTLIGVAASLAGVVAWVLLYLFTDIIAGLAGALMGLLFIICYKKINPSDKSLYAYILGGVLIVVEIFAAELISLGIIAAQYDVPFLAVITDVEIVTSIVYDVLVGIALSAIVFISYVVSMRKKDKIEAAQAQQAMMAPQNGDPNAQMTGYQVPPTMQQSNPNAQMTGYQVPPTMQQSNPNAQMTGYQVPPTMQQANPNAQMTGYQVPPTMQQGAQTAPIHEALATAQPSEESKTSQTNQDLPH